MRTELSSSVYSSPHRVRHSAEFADEQRIAPVELDRLERVPLPRSTQRNREARTPGASGTADAV